MTTTLDTTFPPHTAALRGMGPLEAVDLLLRDRTTFLHRIATIVDLLPMARALLVTSVVTAALFGASIGAYRGGIQIIYAAIKLPLAVLLTAGLVAPALTALGLAARSSDAPLDLRLRFERDAVLVLAALALGGLVTAALTPVVVLSQIFGVSYHELILTLSAACGVGGVLGLVLFLRGMWGRSGRGRVVSSLGGLALFAVVGSQMSWSLRPFLVRPKTEQVPFVRAIEGSLWDSVTRSVDSARGIYVIAPDAAGRYDGPRDVDEGAYEGDGRGALR